MIVGTLPLVEPKGRAASFQFPPDEGCEHSPKCVDCPLPMCVLDAVRQSYDATRQRRWDIRQRASVIGHNIARLAEEFGVSRRTIHRALSSKPSQEQAT